MPFPFDVVSKNGHSPIPTDATTTTGKIARLKAVQQTAPVVPEYQRSNAYRVELIWHQTSLEFAGGVTATVHSPHGYAVAIPLQIPVTGNSEDAVTNITNQVQRFVTKLQLWDRATYTEEKHWTDLENLIEGLK